MNIQSQHIIKPQKQRHNSHDHVHQQLVFGQSKFIFIEDSSCTNTITKNSRLLSMRNTSKNMHNNNSITKISYNINRPQTGASQFLRNKQSSSSSRNKKIGDKQNAMISWFKFNGLKANKQNENVTNQQDKQNSKNESINERESYKKNNNKAVINMKIWQSQISSNNNANNQHRCRINRKCCTNIPKTMTNRHQQSKTKAGNQKIKVKRVLVTDDNVTANCDHQCMSKQPQSLQEKQKQIANQSINASSRVNDDKKSVKNDKNQLKKVDSSNNVYKLQNLDGSKCNKQYVQQNMNNQTDKLKAASTQIQDRYQHTKINKTTKIDEIKQLFGNIHSYMIQNIDYLTTQRSRKLYKTYTNDKTNSLINSPHLIHNDKYYDIYNNKQTQIQKQINEINQSIIIHNNNSKIYTEHSPLHQQNKSSIISKKNKTQNKSVCSYLSRERAGILHYLKNCETKRLFNLMTQRQINNTKYDNFIDQQFSHQNVKQINGQEIQWVYIKPDVHTVLFNQHVYKQHQKLENNQQITSMQNQIYFVQFLKCLYLIQPNIIKRLFQPSFNNVYSVWLFVHGSFEPVFIDGYFPLDSKLNHFYSGQTQYLWLPVLIKCICKVIGAYQKDKLNQITPGKMYKMLTGRECEIIPHKIISDSTLSNLRRLITKQMQSGSSFVSFSQTKGYHILKKSNNKLFIHSANGKQRQQISQQIKKDSDLLVIPIFLNNFVYQFSANKDSLSKIQFACHQKIQIAFSTDFATNTNQKRIYIYECDNSSKKGLKLILRQQSKLKQNNEFSLARGSYRIFIEDGDKKIHLLFSKNEMIKWNSTSQNNHKQQQFNFTLFSNHEIKISQIQQLYQNKQGCKDKNKSTVNSYDLYES